MVLVPCVELPNGEWIIPDGIHMYALIDKHTAEEKYPTSSIELSKRGFLNCKAQFLSREQAHAEALDTKIEMDEQTKKMWPNCRGQVLFDVDPKNFGSLSLYTTEANIELAKAFVQKHNKDLNDYYENYLGDKAKAAIKNPHASMMHMRYYDESPFRSRPADEKSKG